MEPLLSVRGLTAAYRDFAFHPMSFDLERGEILSVIGESGSGKTTLARAVARLLEDDAASSGQVLLEGVDLMERTERELKKLRMVKFSIAFQNSIEWLNPTMTLGRQLQEVLDKGMDRRDQPRRLAELMDQVGLEPALLTEYPRSLSGGMAQKFLLACAIALRPPLVILDEPTSALDEGSREEFIRLVGEIHRRDHTAFLLITHDLALARDLSTRMMVLYRGHIVEEGETAAILAQPRHPYTRGLINASVSLNMVRDIWGIRPPRGEKGPDHGCPFCRRCTQALPQCAHHAPHLEPQADGRKIACNRGGIVTVLEGRHIAKSFGKKQVLADVNLSVRSGEVVAVIGRSGTGKTTLSAILAGFLSGEGEVLFDGKKADFTALHKTIGGLQMVFQDSQAALDGGMTVLEAAEEPLLLQGMEPGERRGKVEQALEDVGLPREEGFLRKKVRHLSGGEKQRLTVARAITMEPRLLVADEPTSMLDPSTKANLQRMLKQLQYSRGFSMLLVTHDLDAAAKISDRIWLLRNGTLHPVAPEDILSGRIRQEMEKETE